MPKDERAKLESDLSVVGRSGGSFPECDVPPKRLKARCRRWYQLTDADVLR
jgi:hypothetical protein